MLYMLYHSMYSYAYHLYYLSHRLPIPIPARPITFPCSPSFRIPSAKLSPCISFPLHIRPTACPFICHPFPGLFLSHTPCSSSSLHVHPSVCLTSCLLTCLVCQFLCPVYPTVFLPLSPKSYCTVCLFL